MKHIGYKPIERKEQEKSTKFRSFTIIFFILVCILLILLTTKANLLKTTNNDTQPRRSNAKDGVDTNVSFSMYDSICGMPDIKPVISGFDTRIINGENALNNSWPWMVSIRYAANGNIYGHFCGGTLVTEYHVITAAHCIKKYKNSVAIIIGITMRNTFTADNVYYTEGYVYNTSFNDVNLEFGNDIGIYKLNRKVVLSSKVSVACLPSFSNFKEVLDQIIIVTGWGSIDGTNTQASLSNNLQQTTLRVLSSSICTFYNYNRNKLYCVFDTAKSTKSNVCNGDSGGPMLYYNKTSSKWYVYGITSYVYINSSRQCDRTQPSFFTSIPVFINWLNESKDNVISESITNQRLKKTNEFYLIFILNLIMSILITNFFLK